MKGHYFLLVSTLIILSVFITTLTHSFFTNTAGSTGNSFTASSTFPASITPTPAPGDVVINEINWAGNNNSTVDEWVELRNTTSQSINLAGWSIDGLGSSNSTIPIPTGTISANGFFLLSHYNKATSAINIDPDLIDASISISNSGVTLTLKNNSLVVIDTANHTSSWYAGVNSPEPKKSMERISPPGDGTVSTNWQTSTQHTNMDGSTTTDEFGTPKADNSI